MDSKQNKKSVFEAWEVFASRDPWRVSAVFTDDAEWLASKGNAVARDYPNHRAHQVRLNAYAAVA